MPRVAAVTREEGIELVGKYIDHFRHGQCPTWSDPIWNKMSEDVGGRWNGNCVYTNVLKNRRNILTDALKKCNEEVPTAENNRDTTLDSTLDDSASFEEVDDPYEFEEMAKGLDTFNLKISRETWNAMLGSPIQYGDGRFYNILQRDQWTDILSIIIFEQTRLPCAFMFDNGKIYTSEDALHYCRVTGHCSSDKCGNRLLCYVDKDPGDAADFIMVMRAKDTAWDDHEAVYRPLRGIRRQVAGENVDYQGAGNWQKREAALYAQFGGFVGPNVPKMGTLRTAKNEYRDKNLDVKPTDGKDVVLTIEKMRYGAPYNQFIHEVRRDKFYVSFSTHAQMHAYNQYCRIMKQNATPGVDGTGTVAKKIRRLNGTKTGHIFLYAITINYHGRTISVHEMLTESQDTDTIAWWLCVWMKLGANVPPQISCDRSRALMNGICKAMNDQTIKVYKETLFLRATNNVLAQCRPPILTYIRNDVAHVMIMVAKWKEFDDIPFSTVRQFYLYCLALLIDCQTIAQFQEIFLLMLTVGLHRSDGTVIKALPGQTVAACRAKLKQYIGTRQFPYDLNTVEETASMTKTNTDSEEKNNTDSEKQNDGNDNSPIERWINSLKTIAMDPEELVNLEIEPVNSYAYPKLMQRLIELAFEFPLWTAAAISHSVSHASTASTEANFNDLKHRVNKNETGLPRVDKLLKRLYENNTNSATLLTSDMRTFKKAPSPSTSLNDQHVPSHKQAKDPTSNAKSQHIAGDQSDESDISSEDNVHMFEKRFNVAKKRCFRDVETSGDHCNEVLKKQNTGTGCSFPKGENVKKATSSGAQKRKSTKSKAKYFTPRPDIQYRQNLATNIHKVGFLLNANKKPGAVIVNGIRFYASHTCGFDAIVQILSTVMMDDPQYHSIAEKLRLDIFLFIFEFIKVGATPGIYKDRTKLLKLLFPDNFKVHFSNCGKLASTEINMFTTLRLLWEGLFKNQPSLEYVMNCPNCGQYDQCVSILTVDFTVIREEGFGKLDKALEFYLKPRPIRCSKPRDSEKCSNICSRQFKKFGRQILIELDVKFDVTDKIGLGCTLELLPEYLNVGRFEFRRAGVIGGYPGHFIAYCGRVNDSWEVYDDMNSRMETCTGNKYIVPQGVLYVAINSEDDSYSSEGSGLVSECNEQLSDSQGTHLSPKPPSPRPSPVFETNSSNVDDEKCKQDSQQNNFPETPPSSESRISINSADLTNTSCNINGDKFKETSESTENSDKPHVYIKLRKDPDTLTTDNWRNKGTHDFYWIHDSLERSGEYYDTSYGTVIMETLSSDKIEGTEAIPVLLPGNLMPPLTINKQLYRIDSTTNFDSLMHVLLCAAVDCSKYKAVIEHSNNQTMQFLRSVISQSSELSVHEERVNLLYSLYFSRIQKKVENGMSVHLVNVGDSLENTWKTCFNGEPSVEKMFTCKTCGNYSISEPYITVDRNEILQHGFKDFRQSLQFYQTLKKVKCRNEGCEKLCTVSCSTNAHVFIHLNVKMRNRSGTVVKCKIGDLPPTLDWGAQYRLAGVVAYSCGKFSAYCHRPDGCELYDGNCESVLRTADLNDVIEPHGVIYIPQ